VVGEPQTVRAASLKLVIRGIAVHLFEAPTGNGSRAEAGSDGAGGPEVYQYFENQREASTSTSDQCGKCLASGTISGNGNPFFRPSLGVELYTCKALRINGRVERWCQRCFGQYMQVCCRKIEVTRPIGAMK
jgi:hypothetical protein